MTTLLSIGAFARATRLTLKALRLYDELGLLPPARVDPASGYRWYAPEQVERARLVAWLRRLGMPLARIAEVAALPPGAAAEAVAAYWARVEADTAARRELATFLVDHLAERGRPAMTDHTLALRCAARSDRGLVRELNQDAAYAAGGLLAVADGFGAGGEAASAAAIDALAPLASGLPGGADLLGALEDALTGLAVREGAGTTLTALVRSGSRLALVHIGDTRAYLLRDGELSQVTHDHSYVQSLVDEGRLSPEEAESHPQRALLLRALPDAGGSGPDLSLQEPRPGDRYLLCSDGLSAIVPAAELADALRAAADPDAAVAALVDRALGYGAPDNIACVVADVVAA